MEKLRLRGRHKIGERFGRWTVVGEPVMLPSRHQAVLCRCDCGTERQVVVSELGGGRSRSCGCLQREQASTLARRTRWAESHRQSKTPLYHLLMGMRDRCENPKNTSYPWYGGRGIQVCDEWRENPIAFIAYINENLGPRLPGMSIDRIDNDSDYRPGNVRWATQREQIANQRRKK